MLQQELLKSIQKYLARFETQVRIANSNNEYDINIHSENVIIPILNIIYKCQLKNLNYEKKNFIAVDLIDEKEAIAFQVTSTTDITKVKNTLLKLIKGNKKIADIRLFLYLLQPKQSKYSQTIIDQISKNKIKFEVNENIIDNDSIYKKLNEINNIELIKEVELILKTQFSDFLLTKSFSINDYEDFKSAYKVSCLNNFSRVNFFGLSLSKKPREVELYSLFVPPLFTVKNTAMGFWQTAMPAISSNIKFLEVETDLNMSIDIKKSNMQETEKAKSTLDYYSFRENVKNKLMTSADLEFNLSAHVYKEPEIPSSKIFNQRGHLVILGNPGAGKSMLIKFAICKILEMDTYVFENDSIYNYIPLRVELHKYNKFKKESKGSIIDYISLLLRDEYLLHLPIEHIATLFVNFETLVFFDGLDEIFDVNERIEIRNDIENFVKKYKKCRSITTSRFESYDEVKLNKELFSVYEALDFNDDQIKDYVEKWYKLEEINPTTRFDESSKFLIELKNVDKNLKTNPLLLSLILILYRNELELPTSKLDIYESCANTILEVRDTKEKKLGITLHISNKSSVFSSLAFWQYKKESEGKLNTINYDAAKEHIKNYILNKGEFEDDFVATQAAEEFLNFAKVRSMYFENKFTHKTFFEYYTALYIFTNYHSKANNISKRDEIILEYIGKSSWQVVLELLLCKIDKGQPDFETIDEIFNLQYSFNPELTLNFFTPVLKYIENVGPSRINFMIGKAIEICISDKKFDIENIVDFKVTLFEHLKDLYTLGRFKKYFEQNVRETIESNEINKISLLNFIHELSIISNDLTLFETIKYMVDSSKIENEYLFILRCYMKLREEEVYLISLKAFIDLYGTNKALKTYSSIYNQNIFYGSPYFNLILTYFYTSKNVMELIPKVLKIKALGFTVKQIVQAGTSHIPACSFSLADIQEVARKTKDVTIRSLLNNISKSNFPNQLKIEKSRKHLSKILLS